MLSQKALAATAAAQPVYVEDVFSTYLYTDSSVTPTITNGIDLLNEGGLVWTKCRGTPTTYPHILVDTVRGIGNNLQTNNTNAQSADVNSINAVYSNGYKVNGGNSIGGGGNNYNFVSWTFRKAEKFFDVVTYTGDGTTNKTVSHNLGSTPGCVICKATDASGTTYAWGVWHRGNGTTGYSSFQLNGTEAATTDTQFSAFTSTTFRPYVVNNYNSHCNQNGVTYVAYLFAHDAGGFGDSGSESVISCGSYTGNGSATGPTITLGYEPQWLMIKKSSASGTGWYMVDTMRGFGVGADDAYLYANLSNAETAGANDVRPTATGFALTSSNTRVNENAQTYIYIAIRRGPMKTPTTGTSVYEGTTRNGTGAAASITGLAFPPDAVLTRNRDSNSSSRYAWYDKLRGPTIYLDTAATDAEFTVAQSLTSFNQTGESFGTGVISNANAEPYINWQFRRAPGFFDVVCYTGTGTATTVSHNLGVAPDMMIVKCRTTSPTDWAIYLSSQGNNKYLRFRDLALETNTSGSLWNLTNPTASVFSIKDSHWVNGSGDTYVAYLFASCPGVSKVGSYTGTGALQTINCGFTSGARFVLIKRTDSTGDWYVWDSARGIVAGNDPYLLLNSTAAEVTNTDYVDTYSAGFEISSTAPAAINANGGTFIYLAIA